MAKKVTPAQFAAILLALPGQLEKKTVMGLQKAAMRLTVFVEHEIRNRQPFPLVDRGRLVQSVMMIPRADGAMVRVDAPYAPVLEYGARPFMPPLQPILDWVKRKGIGQTDPEGVARAIRWKFYNHGMQPTRFFATAVNKWKAENVLSDEIKRALAPKLPAGGGTAP